MDAVATGTLLGGIGLFLLGMNLMTDSLSAVGGQALRGIVKRMIRRRSSALATGAFVTALLQSSSATTLITVGFVSAGLVTFSESLGLILGANLGTTSTGWIVSLIGLKLKVSSVALPLVGFGALVKLFTRGRRARVGLALSGFGLIFVGIDVMQQGMAEMDIDLTWGDDLPGPLGTLALVGIGAAMTVLMQSSSAAVATTLIALSAGSIDLSQAAALVIGQNVGTTITAIVGAAGGSLSARRTAVAHTLFNLLTGAVALALLGPFLRMTMEVGRRVVDDSPETAIAMFHTGFNLLGVLLVYPWLGRFAKVVERVVPKPKQLIVADLPKSALSVPAIAVETARKAATLATIEALRVALAALRARPDDAGIFARALEIARDPRKLLTGEDDATQDLARRVNAVEALLADIDSFLAKLRTNQDAGPTREEHLQVLRAVDHAERLMRVAHSDERRGLVQHDKELRALADPIIEVLDKVVNDAEVREDGWLAEAAKTAKECTKADRERRDAHRGHVMSRLASSELEPGEADRLLAAARWIGKTPKHASRALWHLAWTPESKEPPVPEADEPEEGEEDEDPSSVGQPPDAS